MSTPSVVLQAAVLTMCLAPLVLLAVLAVPALLRRSPPEWLVGLATGLTLTASFAAAVTALLHHLLGPRGVAVLSYGFWFSFGTGGFAFTFFLDTFSLGFAVLSIGICGVVAAFSFRYLHLEPGFHRYFVQFALFVLGITFVALAGSVEVLFAGWELVGLSSALLVGFFHERSAPVRNALRVFAVYRVSDAAMLSAAVLLHHWAGTGSLTLIFMESAAVFPLHPAHVVVLAILLLIAVAGKSALLPFSGWLPRAMEGPTPSSAVYYGALSIHAGCYLLLRVEPLLSQSNVAIGLTALAGATTAVYATITARVQSDVKSALSYAALTQVGIIVMEIAFGLRTIAFLHIVGHACFRLLQFLSAPNVLHDMHELENRTGGHLMPSADGDTPRGGPWQDMYVIALERGFVDPLLDRLVVAPYFWCVGHLDALDRWLSGSCGPGPEGPA